MLFLVLFFSLIHASEGLTERHPFDRTCHQHDIYHDGIILKKHPLLNLSSSEHIVTYSPQLQLIGGMNGGKIHKIRHIISGARSMVELDESEKRGFVENKICFVSKDDNAKGMRFLDDKTSLFIPFHTETITHFKISTLNSKILYLFAYKYQGNFWNWTNNYYLIKLDIDSGCEMARYEFPEGKKIMSANNLAHYRLVETKDPENYIIYCNSDDKHAWQFDSKKFAIVEKLPYENFECCKTNNNRNLVAFAHGHDKISVCSVDNLHQPIQTFDLVNHSVSTLKFINDSYLVASTYQGYCEKCAGSDQRHPMQHAMQIFNIPHGCIYRENNPFHNSEIKRIKDDYDANGNKLHESLALYNDAHKTWYRLTFPCLVGALVLNNNIQSTV